MNLSRDYMLPPTWLTESGIVIAFSDFVDLYFVVIYYIDVVDKWWYCLDNSRVVQKIIKPTSFYRAMHTWDRMSSVCPAISLKRVKIEEKLLWRTYRNSPTLFRTVPYSTPYGLLWFCWFGLLTCKTVSRITYTVLVETLNPAQSNPASPSSKLGVFNLATPSYLRNT